jgi:hypothetical protein
MNAYGFPLPPPARFGLSSKKKFSEEEDRLLVYFVSVYGPNDWQSVAWNMKGRTIRQCRDRWKYYLNPEVSRADWTKDEDRLLIEKYEQFGPHWSKFVPFFEGRTVIDIKNRCRKIGRVQPQQDSTLMDGNARPFQRVELPPLESGIFPIDNRVILGNPCSETAHVRKSAEFASSDTGISPRPLIKRILCSSQGSKVIGS